MLALALLLAAAPLNEFPLEKGVRVKDEGSGTAGLATQARGIDCVGSAVTCTTDAGWLRLEVGSVGDGGSGGSGAPTTASYITRVAEAGLSNETAMGALGTGLVVNTTTTGSPSIYGGTSCSNQFPRSLNASGAATCQSVVLGTDTTGNFVATPGGNTNEVQYKSGATTLGGIANLETDGTNPMPIAVTSHPSAPASNSVTYSYRTSGSMPPTPWEISAAMGVPLPVGSFAGLSLSGTNINWSCGYVKPTTWSTSTLAATNMGTPSTISGTTAGNAWATTNLYTRSRVVTNNSGTAINSSCGIRETTTTSTGAWLGNAAGVGGFFYATRWSVDTPRQNSRVAVGLFGTTAALSASLDPSLQANSIYLGCNTSETNLSICSNDASGSATCNSLGGSYPCTTAGAFYDFVLFAPPNATSVYYYVERLDSAASTSNTISSDLPSNTAQLSWQHWMNTADGGSQVKIGLTSLFLCIAF